MHSLDARNLFQINQFFLNNLKNSSNNPKSTSSNSTTYWRLPDIVPREEDYVEPWKRQIVIWDIGEAYEKAVNKIIKNCGMWDEGDRKCIKEAANKALLSGPLIWVYSDTYLHGSGTNYYPPVKRGLIKIHGYETSDPYCQLYDVMLHEMLHVGGLPGGIYEPGQKKEKKVEACANLCFQGEEEECQRHSYSSVPEDCNCKEPPPARGPGGEACDDNFSVAGPKTSQEIYESHNPNLLILKRGFYREAGGLVNRLRRKFAYIEPDQSPSEIKDIPPILLIPTGGLFGMEKSEQFKSILREYVSQGGTIIVFAQQHGYEYKALPQGEEIEAQGWREDISCFWGSTYIDRWHPVFTSSTDSLITMSIDGYFTRIPDTSTVLLSRRKNGMPSLFYYPYGEGAVVLTFSFEDYMFRNFGAPEKRKAVVRDLFTWARNPGLEIPEYNLRDNPSPEVSLDLEARNISDKTGSNMKILWLDPDRNQIFEEEKLVSIPCGEEITIPENCIFSEISIF